MLRLIVGGVFDRFPKLKLVVGHLGEGCRSGCFAWTSCTAR